MLNLKDIIGYLNKKIMNNEKLALALLKISPSFHFLFGKEYSWHFKKLNFQLNQEVKSLLNFANKSAMITPYYKNIKKIDNLSEFEKTFVPINRATILKNFKELVSEEYSLKDYDLVTTGGTSGAPAKFYVPKKRYKKEYAFYHKIWSTLGYNQQLRGVIRNERIKDNRTYKINPITKEVLFDGFRNNDAYYKIVYQTLLKFKIKYLQGYPSSIYNFFLFLNKKNLNVKFIKGVFLSSEIFLEHQRQLLINQLNLPILSVYGHSEKLILAVDFKGNNTYQVIEEYGYLELLDENNNVIIEVGKLGEITGTSFDNFGMPLIRYKTGDYSSYLQYEDGKPRLLNGIQGRWQEMKIYNSDGSFVTPTALNLHDELYNYINGLQYIQKEKGKLIVNLVPNNRFNDAIKSRFLNHFQQRMAPDSTINIVEVKELHKKSNGKFLLLDSSLN